MKEITLFILLCFSVVMVRAQYPQTLPITHAAFFASGAMGTDPKLEKGEYPESSTSATIMANQWNLSTNSGARAGSSPNVENSTLSYPNFIDNNAGKAIILLGSNATRRSIYSLTSGSLYANTDFYLGALVNVSAVTASGYILSLDGAHTNNVVRAAVFVRADADGFNIGMSTVNNTTNVFDWSEKLNFNQTYFIVIKVNPKAAATYTFYVNPTIGNTEAQSTALSTNTVASGGLSQIRGINVQHATGIDAKIAGLRFSDNWADVVKSSAVAPKLVAPTVSTATSITSSGFTANWTAVDNASSYDVQVYQGESIFKTTNFSGQSTSSGAITGLYAMTSYTYRVVAKGDGVNYSDSDPSGASAQLTTSVFTENFASATVDGNLEGYNAWAMSTNTSWDKGTSPLIGATALIYPGYPESNSGLVAIINKDNQGTEGQRASVKLTSLAPLADGTAVYASFLVKVDDASGSGLREFFALNQSMAEFTRCRVSAEYFPDDNTVKFAVGKASAKSNPSAAFSDADTHLLVVKYDKIAGSNNDKISLYINPDLTLGESEQANAILNFEDDTQTDWTANPPHLLIRQTGIGAKLGGFRVGNTWEQVIPAASSVTVSNSSSISAYNLSTGSQLTVAAGAHLTVDAAREINSVTVASGGKLTVNAALTGTITLESDANATATIMDSYEAPTINATVKQHVTAGRNWYMSAPLNNANVSSLNRGASVQHYNETTGQWEVASGAMTRGKGYIQVANSSQGTTGTVEFAGTTNSGNVAVTLTNNSGGGKGFNLVGNPYPSYLKWGGENGVVADNAAANMPTGTMWYRTVNYNGKSAWAPNTSYSLDDVVYNGIRFYKATQAGTSAASGDGPTGGVGATGIVDGTVVWSYQGSIYIFATVNADGQVSPSTVSNLIPPMQAFWVKSNGGTLTFKNAMRQHETVSNKLKAPGSSSNVLPFVRLSVSNGATADEAVIYASERASNTFDSYDAPKYFNTSGSNQAQIFTSAGTEKLAINALSSIEDGTALSLGFVTETANSFGISATEVNTADLRVILRDNQNSNEFDLTNCDSYVFSATSEVNDANRFTLIFRAPDATTAVEKNINQQVFVVTNASGQIEIHAPANSSYAVFNAMGQKVSFGSTSSEVHALHLNLSSGMYVVKVNDITGKVIIK